MHSSTSGRRQSSAPASSRSAQSDGRQAAQSQPQVPQALSGAGLQQIEAAPGLSAHGVGLYPGFDASREPSVAGLPTSSSSSSSQIEHKSPPPSASPASAGGTVAISAPVSSLAPSAGASGSQGQPQVPSAPSQVAQPQVPADNAPQNPPPPQASLLAPGAHHPPGQPGAPAPPPPPPPPPGPSASAAAPAAPRRVPASKAIQDLIKAADLAPPIAASPAPHMLYHNYKYFLNNNGLTHSTESVYAFNMYRTANILLDIPFDFRDAPISPGVEDFGTFVTVPTAADANNQVKIDYTENYPVGARDDIVTAAAWELIRGAGFSSARMLLDLVGAYQATSLEDSNIENYMKMQRIDIRAALIKRVISYLATKIPDLTATDEFLERAKRMDWLRYRLTATSTPSLVMKCVAAVGSMNAANPGNALLVLGPATAALLQAAVDDPFDKAKHDKIPRELVAVTHIFLDIYDLLPKNWYQGKTAVGLFPATQGAFWREVFRAHRKLTVEAAAAPGAFENIAALVAAARSHMPSSILL